jgi:D-alanyl-D-alanine dipeptidase
MDEHNAVLDMGAGFDEMHDRSHPYHPSVPPHAQRNRLLLNAIMFGGGFVGYQQRMVALRTAERRQLPAA